MIIGKVIGLTSSSKILQDVCQKGAKYFKKAPVLTRDVLDYTVKTNFATGTEVLKLADGTKSIVLGSGNKLSKFLGEGSSIVSYPKGSFLGGAEGCIIFSGKKAEVFRSFAPKEFGNFVNMLKELHKINNI